MPEVDVVCFGETMAMFAAQQTGDLAQVQTFAQRIAGADSNVAIGLSRLGLRVRWLSRVGNDALGRFVLDTLRREGLDCSHVAVDARHPTGFQLKSRCDDGSDPLVEYFRAGSAASHLSSQDLDPRLLSARHLHATGIVPALSRSCRALSHSLVERMREAGASVSFDPNLRPSLWPDRQTTVREINALAIKAHWVLPGLEEGRVLTGQNTPQQIAAFYLDHGVERVMIKLGAAGAYYRDATGDGLVPPVPVNQVVDTVGAGDAFAVGVISALLDGLSLDAALARGNWCGSRAVQSPGDMEGLPLRHELESHNLRASA
ncbi:sugar kinase [Pseudomonas sp. S75]|uniref:sugar kinase n=1 Tax=unclassified Pseudomonas TaxID=196821 RepID=UPI001908E467|nr:MULTISPECIES: sugar kinase [unclassified Pseudomonas]MBJ9975697.1 sugar kinase [Pseudomonas sp. S30]MBK0153248.1 sugar kinase [Pseudomonas sp. S75]